MAEPYHRTSDQVLADLDVDPTRGLDPRTVRTRRRQYGANRLRPRRRKGPLRILIDQFKSIIIVLLAAAAVASAALGRLVEGLAIGAALIVNAAIGFTMEMQSLRSMRALHRLGETRTRVRRGAHERAVPSGSLVWGDVVLLEAGDVVPADIRLIEANSVLADEAALTGESTPVPKSIEPVARDTPLGERSNMLFKGTALTQGSVTGVVTATGMETELGHISAMVEEAKEERTPLERRLDQLGHRLMALTVAVAVVVSLLGLAAGKPVLVMVETALALAIAAVPEGLPVVATIALARGMHRMANRQALIKRLSAVETLGAANVIFTDKTGTLTENRMVARRFIVADNDIVLNPDSHRFERLGQEINIDDYPRLKAILQVAVLCNNASLNGERSRLGDPIELALLDAGRVAGFELSAILEQLPEVREVAFDPERKMMATIHDTKEGYRFAVKGAPEAVIDVCTGVAHAQEQVTLNDTERTSWLHRGDELARHGLRVLGFARKQSPVAEAEPYTELTLLGLIGLYDPPRKGAAAAVADCQQAGIRVVMITGDHPATARNIAQSLRISEAERVEPVLPEEVGDLDSTDNHTWKQLAQAAVFARVTPEEKLRLVTLFQKHGYVVAMTGDGINDAPALKKADIGIAMGSRGTEVAREAADMVLRDDAFSSIVAAIQQGRAIFSNIRQFIVYLLSGNLAEIMAVSVAAAVNAPLPLLPLQILFINFISDVLPALALGVGPGPPDVMEEPPRDPHEHILTKAHWSAVVGYGIIIAAPVLGVFAYALTDNALKIEQAVTISFLTFGFARLWHVWNMRDADSGLARNEITGNRFVWAALAVGVGLLLAAVYLPGLSLVLGTVPLSAMQWAAVLGVSLVPVIVGQVLKDRRLLWESRL